MGKHGFRLSDIMPNAWFYKLKDMNKPRAKQHSNPTKNASNGQKQALTPNRASYYFPSNSPIHPKAFDTHFPADSPRKSAHKPPRRKPAIVTSPRVPAASSSSISSSYRSSVSVSVSESESERSYCIAAKDAEAPAPALPPADIVLELRPIATKPPRSAASRPPIQRLRVRPANSPRLSAARKVRAARRKRGGGLAESFAVVKSSSDPKRDFRESMMEMIVENGLSSSKELEELLACYLSLNNNEYHDVIVKVFEEIWFDVTRFVNN